MSTAHEFAAAVTVEALDRDPYPIYARLRDEAPVCLVPAVGLWFVTRWADVEEAATRPDVFAARVDPSPLERTMGGESILLLDGAPQKRLRTMLDPSLRPRVVEATTPDLIEPLVAELLDGLAGRDEAELMSEYFEPVLVLGLGRVLGLGHLDGDTLRRWFHGLAEGAINFEDDPAKWEISDASPPRSTSSSRLSSSGSTRSRTGRRSRRCSSSPTGRSRSASRRSCRRSR